MVAYFIEWAHTNSRRPILPPVVSCCICTGAIYESVWHDREQHKVDE